MIAYIKGNVQYVDYDDGLAIVECSGIGYHILMSGKDLPLLPSRGEEVQIFTYLNVREDAMLLYGFLERADLKVFKLLISVNGIGPKAGLAILSSLSSNDLRFAVLSEDAKSISKAPGVGLKTAQKLILELKDKFKLEDAFEERTLKQSTASKSDTSLDGDQNYAKQEAIEALVALGYSNTDALKAVRSVDIDSSMDVEDILKAALKQISFF